MRKKVIRITKKIIFDDSLQNEKLRSLWQDAFFALFRYTQQKHKQYSLQFEKLADNDPTRFLMAEIVSETISEQLNDLFNYRIPNVINESDTGTLKYVLPTLSFLVPTEIRSFNPSAIEDFCFVVELTTKPLHQLEVVDGPAIKIIENTSMMAMEKHTLESLQDIITIPLKSDLKVSTCYMN